MIDQIYFDNCHDSWYLAHHEWDLDNIHLYIIIYVYMYMSVLIAAKLYYRAPLILVYWTAKF